MAKFGFFQDSFEKAFEEGKSMVKNTGKSLKKTLSPKDLLDQLSGKDSQSSEKGMEQVEQGKSTKKPPQSTPLNFKDLEKKWQRQDRQKINSLRNRLFQRVHEEEKKARYSLDKKEQERLQKQQEEEEKEKQEEARRRQEEAQIEEPQGKRRRSIFSPKKAAKKKTVELKPSIGKH